VYLFALVYLYILKIDTAISCVIVLIYINLIFIHLMTLVFIK